MANRIELRDCTLYFRDGLEGTAAVNDGSGVADAATTATIDTVALNTTLTQSVPIGARFTIAGEAGATAPVHTVTAVTTASDVTTEITFTPAIAASSSIADDAVITFTSQQIEVRIGEGNVTWTEAQELEYLYDRGVLDTVRQGNDVPVNVNLAFTYEFVRTGTSETITPTDAVKGIGGAAGWISAATDKCEQYAVDLVIERVIPCSGTSVEDETITFDTFRYDQLNYDMGAASISVTGRCFSTEVNVTRS